MAGTRHLETMTMEEDTSVSGDLMGQAMEDQRDGSRLRRSRLSIPGMRLLEEWIHLLWRQREMQSWARNLTMMLGIGNRLGRRSALL